MFEQKISGEIQRYEFGNLSKYLNVKYKCLGGVWICSTEDGRVYYTGEDLVFCEFTDGNDYDSEFYNSCSVELTVLSAKKRKLEEIVNLIVKKHENLKQKGLVKKWRPLSKRKVSELRKYL